jgi:hypothetical protein
MGYCALIKFLKDAILIFQIGFNFIRVLQNEGDGAVNLCERSYGRVRFENRFSGPSAPKVVDEHVEAGCNAENSQNLYLVIRDGAGLDPAIPDTSTNDTRTFRRSRSRYCGSLLATNAATTSCKNQPKTAVENLRRMHEAYDPARDRAALSDISGYGWTGARRVIVKVPDAFGCCKLHVIPLIGAGFASFGNRNESW